MNDATFDYARMILKLRDENELLKERIKQLEHVLTGKFHFPFDWRLTPAEHAVLGTLVTRPIAVDEALRQAIVIAMHYKSYAGTDSALRTHMKRLRSKMKLHGVIIKNKYSEGYYIDPATRRELRRKYSTGE